MREVASISKNGLNFELLQGLDFTSARRGRGMIPRERCMERVFFPKYVATVMHRAR